MCGDQTTIWFAHRDCTRLVRLRMLVRNVLQVGLHSFGLEPWLSLGKNCFWVFCLCSQVVMATWMVWALQVVQVHVHQVHSFISFTNVVHWLVFTCVSGYYCPRKPPIPPPFSIWLPTMSSHFFLVASTTSTQVPCPAGIFLFFFFPIALLQGQSAFFSFFLSCKATMVLLLAWQIATVMDHVHVSTFSVSSDVNCLAKLRNVIWTVYVIYSCCSSSVSNRLAGYYCLAGSTTSTQYQCQAGYWGNGASTGPLCSGPW